MLHCWNVRKSKRMIEQLKDHFIIRGFGRVGRGAALEMQRAVMPFAVVDNDEHRVKPHVRESMDLFTKRVGLGALMEQVRADHGCEMVEKPLCEPQPRRRDILIGAGA